MTSFTGVRRREECDETFDWTVRGVQDVASFLGASDPYSGAAASLDDMTCAFLSALRSRDISKACELGNISDNWPALALGAIAHLDKAWSDDTLTIGEIAETYWTLRRTLDELTSSQARAAQSSLFIGTAIIWIPKTEQHTFGPQMLVDNIRRFGWDAHLWHDFSSDDLIEKIGSHDIDVIGVSIGTDNQLDGLADLVTQIRRSAINPNIKILVGGSAIHGSPNLYSFLGADAVSASADDAMDFFERGWTESERREGRFDG
ncbi:B12-binding domain-containing protein [Yoonia sp. R2331]|uniref:cobalamin B12-binding domain-containing protein n=1 Tax=Yoonia sp. R2331 TaxID=3237238 RepID=UPI0034E47584